MRNIYFLNFCSLYECDLFFLKDALSRILILILIIFIDMPNIVQGTSII